MRRFNRFGVLALLSAALLGLVTLGQIHQAHAATAPAALHVQGNNLVDAGGTAVKLHGVDKSGTEYACIQGWGIFSGPNDAAFVQTMVARHIHVVRIPLNEDCWLNVNMGGSQYGGATYQTAIEQWVSLLNSNGIYAVPEIQWSAPGTQQATVQSPMPDADHSTAFWRSVATAFANQPGVLFDLFNEPHDVSWGCWRDGGAACTANNIGYTAVGMQSLIATIRATGAKNVVMVEGLDWANDLTQMNQYFPADSANNTMASTHIYDSNACATTTCWQNQDNPVAAQHPLWIGEFGLDTVTFGPALVKWADSTPGVTGYAGWTYNSGFGSYSMLNSDDTTLTSWGQWNVTQLTHEDNINPTPTPTQTGTPSPTTTPTNTPTPTPTQTGTPTPTPTQTGTPTPTPKPSGSPAFRGAANATTGNGVTSLAVSRPAGVQAGDVEFATVALFATHGTITAPSGWVQDGTTIAGSTGAMDVAWFHHVAGTAEPGSYTFTWQSGSPANLSIDDYSGVNTSTPENVTAVAHGYGNSVSVPSLTPTASGAVQIALAANYIGPWGATPSNWTQDSNDGGQSNGAYRRGAALTAGTATGTTAIPTTGAGDWAVLTIALTPAA